MKKEYISTENYYNTFAHDFIENTFNLSKEMSEILDKYIASIPSQGKILDVGCGSGRDSLTFLQKGFDVTSFDSSKELAKLASEKINHPVLVASVETMTWENTFDGIWAMASLLHLKKEDLPNAITNCVKALKIEKSGTFFASFKVGEGEGYDNKGRYFSYYKKEELKHILEETGYFENIDFLENGDKLNRSEVQWISVFAKKKPDLVLANVQKNKKRL